MNGPEHEELSRLAAEVVAALKSRGLTIATAEATNGGLIGYLLTEVPGSSAVFRAGVAPYSNDAKRAIGVSTDVLREFGAVSRETAEALATAAREWARADIGLAETGIAGPTGGTPEHPAGLFWIAVTSADHMTSERFIFEHDRARNRVACAKVALEILFAMVRAQYP